MKELPSIFTGRGEVRGFEFRQLAKSARAYLYEVRVPGTRSAHYEVFEHKENPQYGVVSYPGSKSFGISACCIKNKASAWALFARMSRMDLDTSKGRSPVIRRYLRQKTAVFAARPGAESDQPSKSV